MKVEAVSSWKWRRFHPESWTKIWSKITSGNPEKVPSFPHDIRSRSYLNFLKNSRSPAVPWAGRAVSARRDIPFFARQIRLATYVPKRICPVDEQTILLIQEEIMQNARTRGNIRRGDVTNRHQSARSRGFAQLGKTHHFITISSCALRQHQQQMMMASPLAPHDIPYGSYKHQTKEDYFDTIANTIQNMVVFSMVTVMIWSIVLCYCRYCRVKNLVQSHNIRL